MIVLYVLGYFIRNKQNSYAALNIVKSVYFFVAKTGLLTVIYILIFFS